MKGKKFFLLNLAFLFVNILLLFLSILAPDFPFRFGQTSGFHPIKSQAFSSSFVGQLRFPKDLEYKLEYLGNGICESEFCGIDRGASPEGYDVVKIRQTLKSSVGGYYNYIVLRFCPEDGYWYIIYYPNFMEGKKPNEVPGTRIANYDIPPDLINEPGTYAIGVKEKGYCKFEIE